MRRFIVGGYTLEVKMLTYIAVVLTLILITQVIRVTQNGISLYRQNKAINEELNRLSGVTDEDLEIQKKAYRLIVSFFENIKVDKKDENRVSFL